MKWLCELEFKYEVLRTLRVHSPQHCVAQGLGSVIGNVHYTPASLPASLHCRESLTLVGRSSSSNCLLEVEEHTELSEFPGKIYRERQRQEALRHEN